MTSFFFKDPSAVLPYTVNWSAWLPVGETISGVVWTIPAGLTLVNQSNTATSATALLSGGTVGEEYKIGCRITTNPSAYVDERSIRIRVEER